MADEIVKKIDHTITLTGIALIKNMLVSRGWYEGADTAIEYMYRAGDLLSNELASSAFAPPVVPDGIKYATREAPAKPTEIEAYNKTMEDWGDTFVNFPLEDSTREAVKACLKHHIKQGQLVPGRHVNILIREFSILLKK